MLVRLARAGTACACLAMVAIGCAASDGESSQSEDEPVSAPDEAPDEPNDRILNVALGWAPRSLNPAVQSGMVTAIPGTQLFASPVLLGDNFEPVPYLAQSWEISDDGLEVTLDLVEDATFHDGEAITATDVAFSVQTVKEYHPFGQSMLGMVDSVQTPDDHTVVMELSSPHPAIMVALSPPFMPVLPEHVYGDGQEIVDHPRNTQGVVGSGPFELSDHVEGQRIVFERYEGFFIENAPRVGGMVFRLMENPTQALLAVETGEAEMTFLTDPADLERAADDPGVTVAPEPATGTGTLNWLGFNLEHEILGDVRVRQAIAYAIDVGAMSDRLHGGIPALTPSPIHVDSPYYNPDVESYDLDVERAVDLLDDAGFPEGNDGQRFELELDYIPGLDAYQKNVAEVIRADLAEVGIAVSLRSAPDFPTWASRVSTFEYDFTVDSVWNWGDPLIGVHRSYRCDNIVEGALWANMSQYCNPAVDSILDQAATEINNTTREELYREFQDIILEDLPVYPMMETPIFAASADAVMSVPSGTWGPMSPFLDVNVSE